MSDKNLTDVYYDLLKQEMSKSDTLVLGASGDS